MISNIYRSIVPSSIRRKFYSMFLGRIIYFFRNFSTYIKSWLIYLFKPILPKTEYNEAMSFIGKHGITSYPYEYSLKYKNMFVEVEYDEINELRYILHNNRKLYFPTRYSNDKIKQLYRSLVTEQDSDSAHRYVESYDELKGMILLDIGSAEGIFALDTIDFTQKVYLFECEPFWVQALEATFRPWKDKVCIIQKYVSDRNEDSTITLDSFLQNKERNNLFIKMDIEGAEQSALQGAKNSLIRAKASQFAVTTYHKPYHPKEIEKFFHELGYSTYFTQGMLFWGKRLSKALIRARKQ